MKALMSALRSEAVMFDDTQPVSRITAAGVDEVYEDSPFFPADAEDWMTLDDVTEDQARSRLEEEVAAERVLTLFLPLFDSSLSRLCRVAIAGELEDALTCRPHSICKARTASTQLHFQSRQDWRKRSRLQERLRPGCLVHFSAF